MVQESTKVITMYVFVVQVNTKVILYLWYETKQENTEVILSVRLSTTANCAFPVVAARVWNDHLPSDVTSAESLSTFRQ